MTKTFSISTLKSRAGVASIAGVTTATALLMVGLGGATAAPFESEPEAPVYELGKALPTSQGFSPETAARFAALRGPRVNVPEAVKAIVPNGGGLGANVDLAQAIDTIDGTAYVFPAAKDGVCVVTPERNIKTREVIPGSWGVGCTSRAATRSEITITDSDEEGRGRVLVLVADDARATLKTREGDKVLEPAAGVVSAEIAAGDTVSVSAAK